VQLWQRTFDNPGTREQSTWVTVDKAGNIIVTGTLVSTSFDPQGMVVLKYDAAGNLLVAGRDPADIRLRAAGRSRRSGQCLRHRRRWVHLRHHHDEVLAGWRARMDAQLRRHGGGSPVLAGFGGLDGHHPGGQCHRDRRRAGHDDRRGL
jgi:hypothetical protein